LSVLIKVINRECDLVNTDRGGIDDSSENIEA